MSLHTFQMPAVPRAKNIVEMKTHRPAFMSLSLTGKPDTDDTAIINIRMQSIDKTRVLQKNT